MVNIFSNPIYILIIVVNIVIIAAIVLTLFETKLRKKATSTENSQEKIYLEDLNLLKKSNQTPEAKLYALNGIAKNFFQTTYNLNPNKTYSELSKDFKKLNNKKAIKFSEQMLISYYTKERLSENETKSLIDQLVSLIESSINKPIQKLPEEESQITKTLDKIKSIFEDEERKEPRIQKDNSQDRFEIKNEPKEIPKIKKEKPITISHELLKKRKKEKLLQEIHLISKNQVKINDLIQEVYSSNGVKLIEENPKTDSELYELFQENPKIFKKFQEISGLIERNNEIFTSLFNHAYNYSEKSEKRILNNLIEDWKNERRANLNEFKNPFKIQIKESELIYKYFTKLNSIIKNLINKESL